jgi:nucleotide-binding universal stress UspA family protein
MTGTRHERPEASKAAIQRLLFVADAAVVDADELPTHIRRLIDEAADVYVLTPTLPGRLAWLADDVDGFRHVADDRLDTVLGHLRAAGAAPGGSALRGSVLQVIRDAVEQYKPDHVVLALRSSEHANWQEHRLVEHVEQRFGLPVTSYAVDPTGHASRARGPLLLCYDGSENARGAIEQAGVLFAGRDVVVVTVWQPLIGLDVIGWMESGMDTLDPSGAAAEEARRICDEGVRTARDAGLRPTGEVAEASGPLWEAIVEVADRHDAAVIVMGPRGLSRLSSTLLGSVSRAVVDHTDRPTLVVRRPAGSKPGDTALTDRQSAAPERSKEESQWSTLT